METPLTVIGWFWRESEKTGKRYLHVFATREIPEGKGYGLEAVHLNLNPEYVKYDPCLNDVIIAIDGRYGVDRIIRLK